MNEHITLARAAGICGILWIVLLVVGSDVVGQSGDQPGMNDAPQVYADWVAGHSGVRAWAALWIVAAGFGFGLLFVALVAHAVSASGVAARIVLAAGTMAITIKLGSESTIIPLLFRGDENLDPNIVRTLSDMVGSAFALTFLPLGIFTLATAAGGLRTGFLRPWVAWAGGVAGVALLVGMPMAIDGPGFLGMLAFLLWVVVAGVSLLVPRRGGALQHSAVGVPVSS